MKISSKYGYIECINQDENVWFTSDHHFFHKNIIRLANRPFSNVEEMTEKLISNWNSVVKPDDVVFNLGDFCWSGSCGRWVDLMEKLNGVQILIIGNHDDRKCVEKVETYYRQRDYLGNIVGKLLMVRERLELRSGTRRYILDHFPQWNWEGKHYGTYHLHGHIHEKDNEIGTVNTYNVAVERNDYRPISLKELNIKLDQQRQEYFNQTMKKDIIDIETIEEDPNE